MQRMNSDTIRKYATVNKCPERPSAKSTGVVASKYAPFESRCHKGGVAGLEEDAQDQRHCRSVNFQRQLNIRERSRFESLVPSPTQDANWLFWSDDNVSNDMLPLAGLFKNTELHIQDPLSDTPSDVG